MALFPDIAMAIPRALILAWLAAALLLAGILVLQWYGERKQFLPVPSSPAMVRIDNGGQSMQWQRQDGRWLIDGKPAEQARIEAWFAELRACRGNYDAQEIAPTADPHPVTLDIDGMVYHLGAANPFGASHYITHQNRVWLCKESVKATLRLPVNLWLEKNDDARTP